MSMSYIAGSLVINVYPSYNGYYVLRFRPPRFMGDGFVVLQGSDVDIYYYCDQPGTF